MSSAEPRRAPWRKCDTRFYLVSNFLVVLLGLGSCLFLARTFFGSTAATGVWSFLACFYFLFYYRVVQIVVWSWDTLRYLRRGWHPPTSPGEDNPSQLPLFHVLIAAYQAADSISPVLRALAAQSYPASRFHVWIICEHSEQLKKQQEARSLIDLATARPAYASATSSALLRLYWRCVSGEIESTEDYLREMTAGRLRSYLKTFDVAELALEDLLFRLLRTGNAEVARLLGLLGLSRRKTKLLKDTLQRVRRTAARIGDDFARLLGSSEIYRRSDLELELVRETLGRRPFRRLMSDLCGRLAPSCMEVHIPAQEAIGSTAQRVSVSTQQVVKQEIARLEATHFHLLDPHNRGFKPGALNVAYREIEEAGLLSDPQGVYFLVIDSDSLLPADGLLLAAQETRRSGQERSILQMASIPTANFFVKGWFSKFISFADAIGAVGKWARSTRRQLKPDLHAGSGVVVPATLAEFVARLTGKPWDESTLTEDARLIIGQFGLMNGARNRTGMVPVYLLEAVPAQLRLYETYKSFWNQRRRWATGGYDEFHNLLVAPSALLFSRFDPGAGRWDSFAPGSRERAAARIRQAGRLLRWTLDHFWWGLGGFIILTHWWLISSAVAAPGPLVARAGLCALLLTPLVCLVTAASQLAWFIPGGLSVRRLCLLYLQSFVAIWLYGMPVVVTQLACLLGFRGRYTDWKSTQKPRYQEILADVKRASR
jgi:cellulose synthase/poly-beta-1,6-N-acetylglucosamine synthase-like glycosyltransferase